MAANVPATGESIVLLNSEAIRLVIDSESDFITTDFIEPENQTATVAKILAMLNLCTNNRRKLGLLHGKAGLVIKPEKTHTRGFMM